MFKNAFANLQKVGKSLMLPVSVLPIAGILLGVGSANFSWLPAVVSHVMAEAGGECFEGKVAVAIVVLNRIKSNEFPADIESVITQPKQFSPVESGKWQRITASVECFEAVDVALSNADNGQGALFFESCTGESWQSNNREYLYQIGNHRFYR